MMVNRASLTDFKSSVSLGDSELQKMDGGLWESSSKICKGARVIPRHVRSL